MLSETEMPAAHPLLGDDVVLTADQAAKALLLNTRTLERYRALGEGPKWRKIGPRRIGYRLGDLKDYIRGPAA
jgi:hypothetical protein